MLVLILLPILLITLFIIWAILKCAQIADDEIKKSKK